MKQKKSSMSRIVQLYDGSRYVNCEQADNEGGALYGIDE